ncbi:hypothetical protein Acr_16g0002280 [Actinidia rufa]|uniref:Uncharacterized protein n=1 Tax=Actinidia rufa TaxID=165716 RepID=A0A7J0FYH8_9ERIC|nr:hypothetical protein Acr_16g0002280 [Actinidia rufa]
MTISHRPTHPLSLLLSPAHLDESKPTWMSPKSSSQAQAQLEFIWSVHVTVVPLVDTELQHENRVGNRVRTRPHAPFEDRRVRSISVTRPGRSHALPRARGGPMRPHAPGERLPRAHALPRAEQTAHAPARAAHAPGAAGTRATRGSRARRFTRQGQLVHAPRAAHAPGGSRAREAPRGATDCPKYKAQDQSSDTAATVVMADDDEIEVLLAASDDGKSDWHARDVYGWRTTRLAELLAEGQSDSAWQTGGLWTLTEVRHVPNLRKNLISIRMLDAKGCKFDASGGILRVSKGNREMLWGKKTGGLYRLEESVQTGGATVRHGSSVLARRMDKGSNRCTEVRKASAGVLGGFEVVTRAQGDALGYVRKSGQTRVMQLVQNVHREAQRKETNCAHKGGEMESRQLAKLRTLRRTLVGVGGTPVGGAGHLGEKVQALRCGGAYTSMGSGVAR